MKIRIKGNSVRYRLTKSEVTLLNQNKYIEERTCFITGEVIYTIRQTSAKELTADFIQNTITLYVPQALLQTWVNTDKVGIEANMALPDNNFLYLLLEKDFKCIDADITEDQSDFFENPHLTC